MERHLNPAIQLVDLCKSYGKDRGIENISFTVNKSEVFGFLGPNGSGKSTTMRTMLGLIKPTSGSSLILGQDSLLRGPDLKSRIGYLPGALSLYKNMTSRQYFLYLSKLRKFDCRTEFVNLADRLKLDLDRHIHDLSKGNRQKVGVIQAFMHKPEILILDEPTSGLDPLIQQEFEKILNEAKQRDAAILLSSHVLSEVENLADRVAVISEGKILLNEEISVLKARAEHTITFSFLHLPELKRYQDLARDVNTVGNSLVCTVSGPEGALLKLAAADGAVSVKTHEPSLDQIFLTFLGSQAQE